MIIRLKREVIITAVVTTTLGLLIQSRTQADLTVVSNVTVTGKFTPTQSEGASPLIPFPTGNVTTYYHGDLERIEADGVVTLFDTSKDRVTIINPSSKSYIVLPIKKTLSLINPPANPALSQKAESNISSITEVSISQHAEKKTIADRDAVNTSIVATVDLTQESQTGDATPGLGRRGGRGGYGRGGTSPSGGGQTPRPGSNRRAALPTYQVVGEYWMSGEIAALNLGVKNKKLLLTPSYLESLAIAPSISTLVRPVAEKMAGVKGYPLMSRISISRILTNQDIGTPPEPVVITTEVKSINEGALIESLFKVPDGYTEIKPMR